MANLTTTASNNFLLLLFENTDWANIGDAAGLQNSTTAGSFYISLHTADPSAGNQSTSEATYTGYARVAVARAGAQWTTASGATENTNAITFAEATGGSNTITHVGIGTDSTGTGNLIFAGALDENRPVSSGTTLEFPAGALDISVT